MQYILTFAVTRVIAREKSEIIFDNPKIRKFIIMKSIYQVLINEL
jgi:hypothetical protein